MRNVIKKTHENMIKVIGKGANYIEEDKCKSIINDYGIDSFTYITNLNVGHDIKEELIERNHLRLWEPYISEFREEVQQIIIERLSTKQNHQSRLVTAKQEQFIKKLYMCGYSTRAISEALEGTISSTKVCEVVKELPKNNFVRRGQVIELLKDIGELDLRKYIGSGSRLDFKKNTNNVKTKVEVIDKMYILYKKGLKHKEIAEICNVSVETVNNYVDRYFRRNLKGYTSYDVVKQKKKN